MTKSLAVCILAIAVLATSVAAQLPVTDVIYLGETTLYSCSTFDRQPGLHTIDVYHTYGFGLRVRFRVEADPGVTMVYAGETHHFPATVGNSQTGVQICYDQCMVPGNDVPLISINYVAFGTSSSCASIRIVPHPDAEVIEVTGCDGVPKSVYGGVFYINPGAFCSECGEVFPPFEGVPEDFSCEPLPIAATTWGAIKALYR